jgi:hypothetical protein
MSEAELSARHIQRINELIDRRYAAAIDEGLEMTREDVVRVVHALCDISEAVWRDVIKND